MHSAEFNRVAFAFLGAILFAMLLTAFSNLVFAPAIPKVAGYALPSGEANPQVAAAPEAPKQEPLPVLFAKAEPRKGEADAKVCATCHNFEKGGGTKVGPSLYDVVGRPVASVPGFAYSDSLKAIGGDWTFDKLNSWIENPKAMASATKMAYPGEKDAQKRADIIDYLDTLSEKPVPLPK